MCDKPVGSKFNHPACIKRQCKECGTQKLSELHVLQPLLRTPSQEVTWTKWEVVSPPYYGKQEKKEVKKRKPIQKQDTIEELLGELKAEAYPHAEHLFNKDWQNMQEADLISNLRADEALGVYDFAENFKCGHQREVQSAYYSQDSVTIHPVCDVLQLQCLLQTSPGKPYSGQWRSHPRLQFGKRISKSGEQSFKYSEGSETQDILPVFGWLQQPVQEQRANIRHKL